MMRKEDERRFETADFHLTAFLLASGLNLADAQLGPDRRIRFSFLDPARCTALARAFCAGNATISARALVEAQQRLRDLRDVLTK